MNDRTTFWRAAALAALMCPAGLPFGSLGHVYAQTDNIWVIGNKKLDFNAPTGTIPVTALPTPGGTGYSGAVAQYCQNAQFDVNGELIFFIVDGKLYDRTGALLKDYAGDNGVTGIQQVVITLWPGSCDKYLIVFGLQSAGIPSVVYSTFDLASGTVDDGYIYSLNFNAAYMKGPNIQFAVYEPQGTGEVKTLFIRDAKSLYQTAIDPDPSYYLDDAQPCSPTFNSYYTSPASTEFAPTGDLAVKKVAGGTTIRMAMTVASDGRATPLVTEPTLFVGNVTFSGGVPTFTMSPSTPISTSWATTNVNTGNVRGICFSPNGRYLYFSQAFPPYIGYVDLNPATPTLNALAVSGASAYGSGQISCNKSPDGSTYAIYYPKSGGMGCLKDPDNPNLLNWVATVPFSSSIGTMPVSQATSTYWPGVTQYLMDTQTPNDKQIPNLQVTACCREAGLVAANSTTVAQVTGTVTWSPGSNGLGVGANSTVVFNNDFVVKAGAKLTVNNMTWRFDNDARLIIEPGAYARFSNCTLDALDCSGQRWPGVEVWGTVNKEQGTTLYPTYQGALTLSGSAVRNAMIGVLVGKRSGQYQLGSGGLLTSSGSTFTNCREGVRYTSYLNFNPASPTVEIDNRGSFSTTTFTVDDQYRVGIDFQQHVYLPRVQGLKFTQCSFLNQRSIYTDGASLQLGQGINSLDASYTVKCGCSVTPPVGGECPTANVLPSKFAGLDHGIEARTSTTSRNFFVDRARFENNVCGIYANAVPNFEVHRSNFIVGTPRTVTMTHPDESGWLGRHRGIYSVSGYGFLIDDNDFGFEPTSSTSLTEGLVIGYSRAHNDMVFRNSAHGLENGYVGEGQCVDITQKSLVGLHFQCNTNNGNITDLWSRQVATDPVTANQSIRLVQGSLTRAADNTFDRIGGGRLDIKNTNFANSAILYWWATPASPYQPLYNTPTYVQEASSSGGTPVARPEGNCDARSLTQGLMRGPDGTEADRTALRTTMDDEQAAYATTRQAYDALLDGGSTTDLLQAINSAWPQDAYDLRQQLLDVSPYVSAEALRALAEQHVMSTGMFTEVSAANPDALRSDGLLGWLRDGSTAGLTEEQLQQLDQAANVRTARTAMEAQLAGHLSEQAQAADLLLATYLADSVDHVDSVRAVWRTFRSPEARYAEVLTYLQQDDYTAAATVAGTLSQEFTEEQVPAGDQARMAAYIAFLEGIHADGRTPYDLDSTEVDALEALAGTGHDRAAVWAHNLLCAIYGRCTAPLTGGEDAMPRSLRQGVQAAEAVDNGVRLVLHPNPADSWVAMDYDLHAAPDQARLLIRDMTGREVARLAVKAAQGQLVWDARAVPAGTYAAELFNGGVRIRTEKLVVRP